LAAVKDRTDIAVPLQRRNFFLNVINGALSMVAMRVADADTVLPLLVLKLAGAEWAIGLVQAIQGFGRVATQVFVARLMDAVSRKMPVYIWGSVGRVLALCVSAAALLLSHGRNPTLVLVVFLGGYFVWMLLNGVTELAWMDVTARSVPTTRRGSLMTGRKFIGLILAMLIAAPLVNYYLGPASPREFPANYGMLLIVNILFFGLAWVAFAVIREPAPHAANRTLTLRHHFARGLRVFRRDTMYRDLVWMRLLMGLTQAFPAFFIAFGKLSLNLPDQWAALFLSIKLVSEMISSIAFGRISDKLGNRAVIVTTAFVALGTFSMAAAAAWLNTRGTADSALPIVLLGGAFCGYGLLQSGRETGEFNYLLDIAPAAKRPSYIGFGNAFLLPLSLLPLIVGWVAPKTGYLPLFGFAALVSLIAGLVSIRLREPRDTLLNGNGEHQRDASDGAV